MRYECPECDVTTPIPEGCTFDELENPICPSCGEEMFLDDEDIIEDYDGFRDDCEADADVLRMAGWGTDEDYGYFGEDEY